MKQVEKANRCSGATLDPEANDPEILKRLEQLRKEEAEAAVKAAAINTSAEKTAAALFEKAAFEKAAAVPYSAVPPTPPLPPPSISPPPQTPPPALFTLPSLPSLLQMQEERRAKNNIIDNKTSIIDQTVQKIVSRIDEKIEKIGGNSITEKKEEKKEEEKEEKIKITEDHQGVSIPKVDNDEIDFSALMLRASRVGGEIIRTY